MVLGLSLERSTDLLMSSWCHLGVLMGLTPLLVGSTRGEEGCMGRRCPPQGPESGRPMLLKHG